MQLLSKRFVSLLPLSLLIAAPLAAQGLLVGPGETVAPPANHGAPIGARGVYIDRTRISAEIVDGIATTTIDQVVHNDGGRDVEATWFLPLPAGAVADAFTMTVGGKEVTGEVLDAGQARSVYESIVRRRRDPGLLEYAGDGMLRARIFPIPAHGEVGVMVRLRQVLQPTAGLYEWNWPLRAASLGDAANGKVGLEVRIQSQTALSTVVTPHPGAEVRRDGDKTATVSLEGTSTDFTDLKVLYGLTEQEFGLHLLPFRTAEEAGYFAMLLSPPRTLADAKVPARCVQFVLDTSGSMKGEKMQQAKAALHTFLASLRREDHFQIITFASGVHRFFAAPLPASQQHIDAALKRVDALEAMGGTNIGDALQDALAAVPTGDDGATLLPQIVFVTDGEATVGVTNPEQILGLTKAADKHQTRVFALGVGDRIDVRLLDDLVAQHRGARDFVATQEKIEAKVDALCQKISRPALTDVEVRCDGLDAYDVHPARTRDLFCGEMLQVVGRYRDSGVHTVTVRGKQNGIAKEYAFTVDFPKLAGRYSFVQTLWARQHVATLLDAIRRQGAKQELIDEVRSLATRYGIVTPYTSQIIVEESERLGARPTARYRGAGDVTPPSPGGGADRGGASAPGLAGPTTGGAVPAEPTASAATLRDFGRARSGEQAIEESKATTASDDFYLGSTRKDALRAGRGGATVRRAADRVFLVVGDDLVEQGLPKDWQQQAVAIEAFSTEYFELLRHKPELRAVLALGDRVVFRDGERIVRVAPKPAAKENEPKPVEKAAEGSTGDPRK